MGFIGGRNFRRGRVFILICLSRIMGWKNLSVKTKMVLYPVLAWIVVSFGFLVYFLISEGGSPESGTNGPCNLTSELNERFTISA